MKKIYISKIYSTKLQFRIQKKKNYREIDYEEKNYFFLLKIWLVTRELDINLYFL